MDHEERLMKLNRRLAQIEAEIARVKALASKEERKKDTRRKILVGGMVLDLVKSGEIGEEQLKRWLDKMLSNPHDRALFDLPPKNEATK